MAAENCCLDKSKPERLERTQTGMIIPVITAQTKGVLKARKTIFRPFRASGCWVRNTGGDTPVCGLNAPSGLAGPTAADNPVNRCNP